MQKIPLLLVLPLSAFVAATTFTGPAYAAAPDQVLGKGTFQAQGPGSFSDTTIRVAASDATPGSGLDAAGTLSVTDAPSNSSPVSLEAEAFCVNADGNRGVVVGTVTQGPEGTVGRTIWVRVTDGGQGNPSVPDTAVFGLSTLGPADALTSGMCATNFVENIPVTSGNFMVHDRS